MKVSGAGMKLAAVYLRSSEKRLLRVKLGNVFQKFAAKMLCVYVSVCVRK